MGVALYHAAFGFTGAYRRLFRDRDMSGVSAHFIMLAVAMSLFAPVLSAGEFFGRGVGGAVAPVSVSIAAGAFFFGIGMQIGGGCASGTLFTVGGGSSRMALVLVAFCFGGFVATFHFGWWRSLPTAGSISLAGRFGAYPAIGLQSVVLGALWLGLRALGCRNRRPLIFAAASANRARFVSAGAFRRLWQGPWPLLAGALALAGLNWLTLVLAGHPWSITWAFTLWAAKAAQALGWDPSASSFWADGFPARALAESVFADTTSVMNMAIVLGAALAAALAGRLHPTGGISVRGVLSAVAGGFLLGYGARLAYGCNIGSLFSGIASTSVHGWVWLAAALGGNALALAVMTRVPPRAA